MATNSVQQIRIEFPLAGTPAQRQRVNALHQAALASLDEADRLGLHVKVTPNPKPNSQR